MTSGRGLRRAAVIAWIALIVVVAIWTERRIADRSQAPSSEPGAQRVPSAPPRPRRPTMLSNAVAAEPRARLAGYVIDADGGKVEGAVISLEIDPDVVAVGSPRALATPGAAAAHTTSDAAGRFAFDPVEPRAYIVTATAGPLIAEPVRRASPTARARCRCSPTCCCEHKARTSWSQRQTSTSR